MRLVFAMLALGWLFTDSSAAVLHTRQPEDGDDDGDGDGTPEAVEEESAPEASVPAAPQPVPAALPHNFQQKSATVQKSKEQPPPDNTFGQNDKAKSINQQAIVAPFGTEYKAEKGVTAQLVADTHNAHIAAANAKQAAKVAEKVATHTVHVTELAKAALDDAQNALHKARVDAVHLSKDQRHSLEEAEQKLKKATAKETATKSAEAQQAEKKRHQMKAKMAKLEASHAGRYGKDGDELLAMREEIATLRKELKENQGDKDTDDSLKDLQDELAAMEASEKKAGGKKDKKSHDEMKAEIERLRADIEDQEDQDADKQEDKERYNVKMKPLAPADDDSEDDSHQDSRSEATPVQQSEQKSLDIDTAMPYGELEPFGREDTAQELTESSIKESDEMVDQLERAEVAEEKRSVFRALTRLRGAAITSFDGVARSQTGNIDGYNKIHKWRNSHPLHHLADEESDISKWAFPEDAD